MHICRTQQAAVPGDLSDSKPSTLGASNPFNMNVKANTAYGMVASGNVTDPVYYEVVDLKSKRMNAS
jgi:hypothetical protein